MITQQTVTFEITYEPPTQVTPPLIMFSMEMDNMIRLKAGLDKETTRKLIESLETEIARGY